MAKRTVKKNNFGKIIRENLKTQRWLSQQTGISEVKLSNKINGIEEFTQDELDKINQLLGTNLKK